MSNALILPERIKPSLGMDGRHHAVPLMAEDKRFEEEGSKPFHPRLGSITHGHGHATQMQAETMAKEIAHRYNSFATLIETLQEIRFIAEAGKLETFKREALEKISDKAHEVLTSI